MKTATLLTAEQIWDNDAFESIKEYGTATAVTDLAVWLGALLSSSAITSDGLRSGYLWSSSAYGGGDVRTVDEDGDEDWNEPDGRELGVRPALPSSSILNRPSEARPTRKIGKLQVYEHGEYPQGFASEDIQKALESAYKSKNLRTTGKEYTFDSEKL